MRTLTAPRNPMHDLETGAITPSPCETGDDSATDAFVARLQCIPRYLAVLNRRAGRALDEHELHDVVQSTVASLWRRRDSFTGSGSLEAWAHTFCVLELRNALRRKRVRPRTAVDRQIGKLLEAQSNAREGPAPLRDDVHAAIARLEHHDADLIRMKHFDELTFEAIGHRLGLPVNTAKSRYYRARERLRAVLAPDAAAPNHATHGTPSSTRERSFGNG